MTTVTIDRRASWIGPSSATASCSTGRSARTGSAPGSPPSPSRRAPGCTARAPRPTARPPSRACSTGASTWASPARRAGSPRSARPGARSWAWSTPPRTSTSCSPPSEPRSAAWRDAGAARPRRAVRRDAHADQRRELRDRERRHAHVGAGVRHGLPGGRPARAGPRARGGRASPTRSRRATPSQAVWEKPQGKRPPVRMSKTFTIVPRGVDLVIGCNTFPTWNSYPGLFAGLATGNAVLVKPHPRAVLPLAITVRIVREVLAEHGFDPDLVCLAAEPLGRPAGRRARRPARGRDRRLHRLDLVRRLARGARPAGAGLHREGRRQRGRRRLHRRLPRACSPTSPSRWCSTAGRCAPPRRTSWSRATGIGTDAGPRLRRAARQGPGRRRRRAGGRRREGRRPAGRRRQRRRAAPAGERARRSARSSSRRGPCGPRRIPTRPCARPRC